jgi:alkaline phosphatase D
VGPDRPRKQDNHANDAFAHEGNELRRFIASQENMMVICGDRHWQYVSTDPETGLREFGCGPASDPHAESFDPAEKAFMLDYLNIRGGFLTVTVDRKNSVPSICFDHYGVDGNRLHRNILSAR